jgi:hypothetical protein
MLHNINTIFVNKNKYIYINIYTWIQKSNVFQLHCYYKVLPNAYPKQKYHMRIG